MSILLYAHKTSPRLQYIIHFIFEELLLQSCRITIDSEEFITHDGIKINYCNECLAGDEFSVGNCGLLFENDIRERQVTCFMDNGITAFFKTNNQDFPFDIFSASFYLLSRYEEYLPHKKDIYGRYAHENSLAFTEKFLHLPLINTWVKQFTAAIQERFPFFAAYNPPFTFIPTYDIDIAWSFKHKGLWRNIGGFLRSPSINRLRVLSGLQKDPFDAFDWLNNIHRQFDFKPLYFFLVAGQKGLYDKNIPPHKTSMWKLVRQHAKKYMIGIHPSWQSGDQPRLLKKEKELLEAMSETPISCSRQHYVRFNLPDGYRRLMENGITDDYSMGYGSINGFRASVASPFFWYDLGEERATTLRIHPFCFMDANSFYEQQLSAAEAYTELMHYHQVCKEAGGQLITIWHNNFLGPGTQFPGWKDIYLQFINSVY